ncbi:MULTISPECIES: gas vesicle protein [unclassified Nocardioides]|uniref:gas vesicle protein GvpO n=1 Tax=unclassified Nocardioides TaxID=2615069 RepID=UPI00360FDE5B
MAETTRKAPAKKAAAKKTAKQPAKKTATKKSTTARTAKSAPRASARPDSGGSGGEQGAPRGAQVALVGAQQLVDLTGKEFEGIVGIAKDDDGWTIQVEVLEMRRIPTTTDVLAVYDVTVDQSGDLTGYRRVDRYVRGSAGEERQ